MTASIQLILGGGRSGKSRFALHQGNEDRFPSKVFLATASPGDEEMRERIDRHRQDRSPGWDTVEEPYHLRKALERTAVSDQTLVVVDCATLWISNLLCGVGGEALGPAAIEEEFGELLGSLTRSRGTLRIVSNEVGLGLIPDNPLGRRFRDLQGGFNQRCAAIAKEAFLLTAGIPIKIK